MLRFSYFIFPIISFIINVLPYDLTTPINVGDNRITIFSFPATIYTT